MVHNRGSYVCRVLLLIVAAGVSLDAAETLWLEAELFEGVRGYCWPMGRPEMKVTQGHWGISGPGWAAAWIQGGESGALSIATGADDDQAKATIGVDVPQSGEYLLWVRYSDWREQPERFEVIVEQTGIDPIVARFGARAVVEEDNEMKLYWGWAFGWDHHRLKLNKGFARLSLVSTTKAAQPRQVDVLVLTTDQTYRPWVKERPANATWSLLDSYKTRTLRDLKPLARRTYEIAPLTPRPVRTFRDQGLLYLWNVSHVNPLETWLSDKPERVKYPYNLIDKSAREEFEKLYGGCDDVPIFSDPRIVPTFHGVGAGVFATDPSTGEVKELGQRFARWLDAHPERCWAMMMNYHNGEPIGERGQALFARYRDRYVGSISGESLGYFYPDAQKMAALTATATTRRQLVEAFVPYTLELNAEKYRKVYGKNLDLNPYADVIACPSVGNMLWAPLCYDWGARTYGYESHVATSAVLGMRMAFMRGAARQHDRMIATYRSCNFGDASTIFSNVSSYTSPQAIYDNYYSVYSGAGMTWYKFDIWYQYMAGSSLFYHEQGFDEFWQPGGTAAAGQHPLQLSPKGKLVDRFLRVTAKETERGSPYTPVAFLLDYAHGWEPSPYWPNSFKNWHQNEECFRYGDHEKMLEQYFFAAWYPLGPNSQRPITATSEVTLANPFGDIFDVIFAYPDISKWKTIDDYPVVILAGDVELTDAEGQRLAQYIDHGGTLFVADSHLTGPGVTRLGLPETGDQQETEGYRWLDQQASFPSQRYRYRPLAFVNSTDSSAVEPWQALATTAEGHVICGYVDRGQGRLIYFSVPRGLGIDRSLHPVVAHLLAHLTRGLMPIEVEGDVNWLVNRGTDKWIVTLLNPYGQDKPQQGITPTDYRQNRVVTIRSRVPVRSAREWLMPDEQISAEDDTITLIVPAGSARIVELR